MKKIRIFRFSENIWICELNLTWLSSQVLGNDSEAYRTRKGIVFSENSINNTLFTENEIKKLNGFPTLKKQIEWIGGRTCVKRLSRTVLGARDEEIEVSHREKGAPYIKDREDVHISITHSGDYALSLLYTGNGKASLDTETVKSRNVKSIGKVALSDRELSSFSGELEEIIRIFTVKEAFLKYIEEGFHESLKKVEVLDRNIFFNKIKVEEIKYLTYKIDNLHINTVLYPSREPLNIQEIDKLELI